MPIATGFRIMQFASSAPGVGDVSFPHTNGDQTTGEGVSPYGYRPFDSLSGNSVCYYMENFDDRDDPASGSWEIGVAPVTWVTNHYELERTDVGAQILESSNADSIVDFSSGTVRVNNVFPAYELGYMEGSNNLSDVDSAATSRTNLGLGDVATMADGAPDADTVDGKHAADLWKPGENGTLTGNNVHSGDLDLSGDNDFTGTNDFSEGHLVLPVGSDKWATS